MAEADFTKDPDATLDYIFDWSSWLASGETISTSTITGTAGINIDSSTNTTTLATAWVSGGTVGRTYTVSNKITTSSSPARTDERSITIRVTQR